MNLFLINSDDLINGLGSSVVIAAIDGNKYVVGGIDRVGNCGRLELIELAVVVGGADRVDSCSIKIP